MSICCMRELLSDAQRRNRAVGSFSVGNMEMIIGAVKAAEDTNTPIILQIAEIRLKDSPLCYMAPMMINAAKKASVGVAVHFDHGLKPETIQEALDRGFTSVMYDGSRGPYEDNIRETEAVMSAAAEKNACVEAELGTIGKNEDGAGNPDVVYTDPSAAEDFIRRTGVGALAVAIGNRHGNYKKKPELRFEILSEIHSRCPDTPLVLHGGTGIAPRDFRRCIDLGIRKINIATANFDAVTDSARLYFERGEDFNYFSLDEAMVDGVYSNVKKHIQIFNNEGELQ